MRPKIENRVAMKTARLKPKAVDRVFNKKRYQEKTEKNRGNTQKNKKKRTNEIHIRVTMERARSRPKAVDRVTNKKRRRRKQREKQGKCRKTGKTDETHIGA